MRIKRAQQLVGLGQGDSRKRRTVTVESPHILHDPIVQLARKLDARRSSAHHHNMRETASLLFAQAGLSRQLKIAQ